MATIFVNVTTYKVFLYGGPDGNSNADATVSLGIPDGWAFLRFYPEGETIPANSKATHMTGKPIYYVNYRYAQFSNIIDILRNEKPIRFFFRDDTKASYITTNSEPIGEEES